ncbi:response regulator [Mucilaginibacter ginsenosidivorans]|uniref:Response regulator n=1 Tax=Mucilaginibacter ginsenosidivorans TaxID=398053 RepID=A0A5B8UX28_9SPHI|nr:response regulator [Mucilaginibacter ginsenosidivorans]QEC63235.1 response regulator [Mucilaginibacter ginsenosidivorans]
MSKLIIIDDDPIHHKIVQYMLTKNELSKETTYTFDGKLVLDYLEENKTKITALPDYIFLDLYMPDNSGWDFLNRFQEIYKTLKKEIKIYIVSSSIFQMDINRSKSYPFVTSYITKPLIKSVFDNIRGRSLKITGAQLN